MSLVWISPAPSSLRRARQCHACMCRGLLPNINGRAGVRRDECVAQLCVHTSWMLRALASVAPELDTIAQEGSSSAGGSGPTANRLCHGVLAPPSRAVGNRRWSLQTAKLLAAVPPDLRTTRSTLAAVLSRFTTSSLRVSKLRRVKKTVVKTGFNLSHSSSVNHRRATPLLGSIVVKGWPSWQSSYAVEQWGHRAAHRVWGQRGRELNPWDGPDDFPGWMGLPVDLLASA